MTQINVDLFIIQWFYSFLTNGTQTIRINDDLNILQCRGGGGYMDRLHGEDVLSRQQLPPRPGVRHDEPGPGVRHRPPRLIRSEERLHLGHVSSSLFLPTQSRKLRLCGVKGTAAV